MSGEVSIDRRLSGSGRFIRDATSDMSLPIGSGSPGLIWRGQYTSGAPVDIGGTAGAAQVVLPGMGGAWDLPPGYRYDVTVGLILLGETVAAPPFYHQGDLIVVVSGSSDGGLTYPDQLLSTDTPQVVLYSNESRCFMFGQTRALLLPTTVAYDHVRTTALFVGSAGYASVVPTSWTKIQQYVL